MNTDRPYNINQRYVLSYWFLPMIQRESDKFSCGHTDSYKRNLCCIYQRQIQIHRSNHRRCSRQKAVLKIFAIFTGKHRCWSLFFNKLQTLSPVTLLKGDFQHRCFPVNIAKFCRTSIWKHICERLLLNSLWPFQFQINHQSWEAMFYLK